MKYKKGEVISVISELKSFSWNDGLFIVISIDANEILHMCKLNKEGQAQKYDDGKYMITCTGVNNKGISKTNLFYNFENDIK